VEDSGSILMVRAFDRVGDETILFGFFQDSRHARKALTLQRKE